MKRLLSIVIIIGIIAYVAVQFLKDRRFNPPADYDFTISEQIDKEFYDQSVVKEYYKTALEVGSYARALWNNDKIDVRFLDKASEKSKEATAYYIQLRTTALWLQDKLIKSKELKDQGFNNTQITMMMEQNLTPKDIELREKAHLIGLKRGSYGAEVWEVQKMLNKTGDSIPEDGLYNQITINRVREFQRTNDLFPSGEIDKQTLKALLK